MGRFRLLQAPSLAVVFSVLLRASFFLPLSYSNARRTLIPSSTLARLGPIFVLESGGGIEVSPYVLPPTPGCPPVPASINRHRFVFHSLSSAPGEPCSWRRPEFKAAAPLPLLFLLRCDASFTRRGNGNAYATNCRLENLSRNPASARQAAEATDDLRARAVTPPFLYGHMLRERAALTALSMVKQRKYQLATDNLLVGLRDAQVQRNLRRKQMIMDYKPLRQYYKHKVAHATSMDERLDWHCRLQRLPRDSSPTRYRNRCRLCGRARGYFRFFGLCRHHVLDMVRNVMLPGFTKAEW